MNESTRIELFLAKIIGEEVETPEPHTRIELFLAKIAGEDVETPTPITRIELFLAKILGESVETPEPHTRIEIYLAAIAGAEITVPDPETRVEYYLNEWASAPTGEETTVTGVSPLLLSRALEAAIISLTQSGKCTQASTPSGSNVPIVCNNGVLKVSPNLLNPSESNIIIGYYYNENGRPVASQQNWRSGLIPIIGGRTYIFYGRRKSDNTLSAYNRINWFDANENNILPRATYAADTVTVGTAPNNAAFAGLSCAPYNSSSAVTRETFDEFNWMFAEASAEIPYRPYGELYADGTPETITLGAQTASAESLYAVGDYADTQEVISGAVTHKVGVKVLDGTESWGAGSAGTGYRKFSLEISDLIPDGGAAVSGLCSHYKWEYANVVGNFYFASSGSVLQIVEESSKSLSSFKSFLAAQYAAGTPVIVLYPLAEPTTESVAGQHLSTEQGDNTIYITANVSDIPIEATYMREVS